MSTATATQGVYPIYKLGPRTWQGGLIATPLGFMAGESPQAILDAIEAADPKCGESGHIYSVGHPGGAPFSAVNLAQLYYQSLPFHNPDRKFADFGLLTAEETVLAARLAAIHQRNENGGKTVW